MAVRFATLIRYVQGVGVGSVGAIAVVTMRFLVGTCR